MKPGTLVAWLVAAVLAVALWGTLHRAQRGTTEAETRHRAAMDSARSVNALRDSVAVHALVQYADEKLRGDSLAAALRSRAKSIRLRVLPGRVDTLLVQDTARGRDVCMDEADGWALLVGDSAATVRADSLVRGWAACSLDSSFQARELAACRDRSIPSRGVWFGTGYAAGLGTCALFRR